MSDVIMDIIGILVGFILLMSGGEALVQGAIRISDRLKVPKLLVGFTVVAIGTSLPELAVALEAVRQEAAEIAIGSVIGSNIANVMLVLGAAAIMGSFDRPEDGVKRDALAVIIATIIFLVFVFMGEVSMIGGIFMLTILILYIAYSYYIGMKHGDSGDLEDSWLPDNMYLAILACFLGGIMIWFGATILVSGATGLAEKFGISEAIIGLTIVALGTSLPELAVTVVAGLRGQGGVAIGNIFGSNLMNILGIIGTSAIVSGGMIVGSQFSEFYGIWMVLITSGFVAFLIFREINISKNLGFFMISTYISYMAYLAYLGVV